MKKCSIVTLLFIISTSIFQIAKAAFDPVVKIQGSQASSVLDMTAFYGLEPSGGTYVNLYYYFPVIKFEDDSSVPQSATRSYEWIIVGGSAPSGTKVYTVTTSWNNTKNYNSGVPSKTIRVKVTFTWTAGGVQKTKTITSVQGNGTDAAQPIEVKHISDPTTISFNGSTLSNGNTLSFPCGAVSKTISIPAVFTDQFVSATYYFYYPDGWTGPASSPTPSVTVTTHVNKGGTIKVEAKRNDSNLFRTKIAITITRPTPSKPVINSNDILLCSPKTITASALNATSYNWTATGGITATSPNSTNSAQITGVADGTVMVSATSSVCAVTTAYSYPINVKHSPPAPAALVVTGNNGGSADFMCNGAGLMLSAYTSEPNTTFGTWTTSNPANSYLSFSDGSAYFNSHVNDCYGIDITVSNCFGSVQKGITVCVDYCAKNTPVYSLYPNPAKDQLTLNFDDAAAGLPVAVRFFSEADVKEVKSVDIAKYPSNSESKYPIAVGDLPRGIYYVHLIYENQPTQTTRIILE